MLQVWLAVAPAAFAHSVPPFAAAWDMAYFPDCVPVPQVLLHAPVNTKLPTQFTAEEKTERRPK